jgi:hypothetical protein
MSASQASTSLPALSGEPTPKRIILPTQTRSPDAKVGTGDKLIVKQSGSPKRGKQRSKKGQRLDLKSLLQGAADETQDRKKDDQLDGIDQGIADLGFQSNEAKNQAASNASDIEAMVETTAAITAEYASDDDGAAKYSQEYDDDDDDAYDEDDVSKKPINLPTQGRLSKKGKGDRWELSVERKVLIGATDGPLAPRSQATKKKSRKERAKKREEAKERERVEEARQDAILQAGPGRMVGPVWGNVDRGWGYGAGGMDR